MRWLVYDCSSFWDLGGVENDRLLWTLSAPLSVAYSVQLGDLPTHPRDAAP